MSVPRPARRPVWHLAWLLALGLGVLAPVPGARAADHLVRITGTLEPAELTIAPGDTVTWRNDDDQRHRMRARSGPDEFDSGDLDPGETFTVTLTSVGTYDYRDERDPDLSDYWGRIVVATAPTATPGPSAPGATPTPVPSAVTVRMAGRRFAPATVTIVAGTRVDWLNDDDREHTVTASGGVFDSGVMAPGATFQKVFTTPGTFAYLCLIHPDMTGTIAVTGAPGATPPPATPTPAPTATPPPPAGDIEIVDFAYVPASIDVPAGTRVTFVNRGVALHTVTATDGSFDSGLLPVGGAFARTFTTPGTFAFLCTLHPTMAGTVRVLGAGGSAPPPPEPTPTPGVSPGTVRMVDFAFLPARIRISAGSTVRWVDDGVAPHTATARGGAFDTGILQPGEGATVRFQTPGTYAYLCAIHPDMTGVVEVAAPDGSVPPPSADPVPPAPSAPPGVDGVRIVDLAFEPAVLAIPVGGTVRWTNIGVAIHTATANDGSFDSGFLATGESFERRFDTPGVFDYVCALHPSMVGTIVVGDLPSPDGSPAPVPSPPGPGASGDPGGPDGSGAGASGRSSLGTALALVLLVAAFAAAAAIVRGVAVRAQSGG